MLETNLRQDSPDKSFVRSLNWEANKVSASLVIGGKEHEAWLSANTDLFPETDFLLPVALLPAMKARVALNLPGRVSPRLLSSCSQIQDIFHMWESIYKHIPVRADPRGAEAERGSGVACFFGGGMDSFHTVLRHHEEISHLIFLQRRPVEDRSVMEIDLQRARNVAQAFGKGLITVETNLHDFADQTRISWRFYHGMWIASTALLLQHKLRKVLIPGSTTSNYDNLRPQGTHPILDPLWSTESVDFRHDGCEVRRVDKAADIAEHEVAMQYLQVCDATKGSHNCGRCKKCLRSMLNLRAAGALERCKTLPHEIDPADVQALDLSEYSESYFARENLRALERSGTEPELVGALEEALDRGKVKIAHSGYKEEDLTVVRERRLKTEDHLRSRAVESKQKLQKLRQEKRSLKKANRSLSRQNARLAKPFRRLTEQNSQRVTHYSARRYQLADIVLRSFLQIPGAGWLLGKIRNRL